MAGRSHWQPEQEPAGQAGWHARCGTCLRLPRANSLHLATVPVVALVPAVSTITHTVSSSAITCLISRRSITNPCTKQFLSRLLLLLVHWRGSFADSFSPCPSLGPCTLGTAESLSWAGHTRRQPPARTLDMGQLSGFWCNANDGRRPAPDLRAGGVAVIVPDKVRRKQAQDPRAVHVFTVLIIEPVHLLHDLLVARGLRHGERAGVTKRRRRQFGNKKQIASRDKWRERHNSLVTMFEQLETSERGAYDVVLYLLLVI